MKVRPETRWLLRIADRVDSQVLMLMHSRSAVWLICHVDFQVLISACLLAVPLHRVLMFFFVWNGGLLYLWYPRVTNRK